jgi:polysaccharide pyruvyl transferase WcaK-like protein
MSAEIQLNKNKGKTILYGAFGRYNFGDLLFPHIVTKLLNINKVDTSIEYCDILSRDMSKHDGHKVKSIFHFLRSSDPINIIHVGGATAADHSFDGILGMFQVESHHKKEIELLRKNLKDIKDFDLPSAYMLSKKSFVNPKIFVANCVGASGKSTVSKIKDYDFLSFREEAACNFFKTHGLDKSISCVDSAIMTKSFFNDTIQAKSKRLIDQHGYGNNYIAVQLNFGRFLSRNLIQIERVLNKIIKQYNLPIVFFAAGTSPGHDNINAYRNLSEKLPKGMSFVSETENIWDVCSIIARSTLVINTSLHVRILSMQYFKPRFTFVTEGKQKSFINKFDNIHNDNVSLSNVCELIKNANEHDYEADAKQLKFLENEYLRKSTWINLLK